MSLQLPMTTLVNNQPNSTSINQYSIWQDEQQSQGGGRGFRPSLRRGWHEKRAGGYPQLFYKRNEQPQTQNMTS